MRVLYEKSAKHLRSLVKQAWVKGTAGADQQRKYISKEEWIAHAVDGSITWERASFLANAIYLCQPRHMLEVGSFLGMSSNFFLRIMEPWGGHLISVDPNVRHRVFDAPRDIFHKMNAQFADRVHTHDAFWKQNMSAESGHWDYENRLPRYTKEQLNAIFAARPVLDEAFFQKQGVSFDMAFVDGAHDKLSVETDFQNILKFIRPKSCIIFDDVDAKAWPETFQVFMDIHTQEVLQRGRGLSMFGPGVALFIDRGLVESVQR